MNLYTNVHLRLVEYFMLHHGVHVMVSLRISHPDLLRMNRRQVHLSCGPRGDARCLCMQGLSLTKTTDTFILRRRSLPLNKPLHHSSYALVFKCAKTLKRVPLGRPPRDLPSCVAFRTIGLGLKSRAWGIIWTCESSLPPGEAWVYSDSSALADPPSS